MQLRNHAVGYFDPLLWAVRVMICVATFCIGGKCSVVLCLKNRKIWWRELFKRGVVQVRIFLNKSGDYNSKSGDQEIFITM